ncbi:TetR/AcrR family transcriptional regulator [Blastococcus sp. TBT05-19]|uniref:TetR family transcriptional regulator n=1 Tax=Blastococcus sp. TBT05-19 TaxID=2250581 RepID=UPI000DEB9875|nr:TetR family transcriptional regulator [Blastococcus sp. TBT05-19]RBY93886.1 TetR/AcrR family transcriptional regulator [Blastococcus sp. TBT05-19]
MKAEAVRRTSQVGAPHDKIAQVDDRRDSRAAGTRDRRNSRWDEHRRARREQLVEAALSAVSRHGSGVGMEEIAAEAGTSKTVVYRHFTDRSDLHVAVCGRVAAQLLPRLREAMDSSDQPRERTAAAIETYLAFLEADPEVYRFVVTPQPGGDDVDPAGTLADLVGDQAARLMAVALERAGRDPAAAGAWGHGVVGLVRSAADWWLRSGRSMLRTELAAHLTDLAWAGVSGVVTQHPENQHPSTGTPRSRTKEEQ